MKTKFSINKSIVFFAVLLVATYIPIFMKEEILDAFVREDRIFENLSPIYLFVASVMFAIAFYRSPVKLSLKDTAWLKRLSFLGFALLFLLATFEEISWGQRILNIETIDIVKNINVQKELNLHNLEFFQGEDAPLPLDFDQLAAIFSLGFGFLIPTVCWLIKPIRQFLETKFPILPWQYGFLILANYILQKALISFMEKFPGFYLHPTMGVPQGVYETREHNYALLLMISAIFYIFLKLDITGDKQEA